MLVVWFVGCELVIIFGGVIAALVVGPDRDTRRAVHQQELRDIDAWLEQVRKT